VSVCFKKIFDKCDKMVELMSIEKGRPESSKPERTQREPVRYEGVGFVTDPQLGHLIIQGTELLGLEGVDRVLQASQRFEKDAAQQLGSRRDPFSRTKQVLTELPACVTAARESGISLEKTGELIEHTIASYDSTLRNPDTGIIFLTQALDYSAQRGEVVTDQDVNELKGMILCAGGQDAIPLSLKAYETARKAGLSVTDSTNLVNESLTTTDYTMVKNDLSHMTHALRTLAVAEVDPELVKQTFQAV
jgi:hypothetical protein